MEIKRLTEDDWKDLLPCSSITLGKTTIIVEPLGVADLKKMSIKIMAIANAIGDSVDFDTPEGMAALFTATMDNAPDVLEEVCGLHRDDIAKLPIAKAIELIRVVLEVNIGSKEALIKNCVALMEMFKTVNPVKAIEVTNAGE